MKNCRFKHKKDGNTFTLEEAGEGATESRSNSGGAGGTGGTVSGGTPKKEEVKAETPEETAMAEAREVIKQRLDMGALSGSGKGWNLDVFDLEEVCVSAGAKGSDGKYKWRTILGPRGGAAAGKGPEADAAVFRVLHEERD